MGRVCPYCLTPMEEDFPHRFCSSICFKACRREAENLGYDSIADWVKDNDQKIGVSYWDMAWTDEDVL